MSNSEKVCSKLSCVKLNGSISEICPVMFQICVQCISVKEIAQWFALRMLYIVSCYLSKCILPQLFWLKMLNWTWNLLNWIKMKLKLMASVVSFLHCICKVLRCCLFSSSKLKTNKRNGIYIKHPKLKSFLHKTK